MLPRTLRADSGVSFGVVDPSALKSHITGYVQNYKQTEPVLLKDKIKVPISFAFRTHETIRIRHNIFLFMFEKRPLCP
jgi:hypothetical protein